MVIDQLLLALLFFCCGFYVGYCIGGIAMMNKNKSTLIDNNKDRLKHLSKRLDEAGSDENKRK
ncbi:MAG: hypothetical protein OEY89_12530 [Gammaproteobacteria bacterium]|nr:hypothetical protein [Gammaproteobacteria bacterium]